MLPRCGAGNDRKDPKEPLAAWEQRTYLARTVALVAQLVEHLICNQGVGSSNLSGGTVLRTRCDGGG